MRLAHSINSLQAYDDWTDSVHRNLCIAARITTDYSHSLELLDNTEPWTTRRLRSAEEVFDSDQVMLLWR